MKLEFYEGKKVLITGHKGFIGSHLWSLIQESNGYGEWQNDRVDLYGMDFPDDIGFFKPPKEKYDCVIHLAAFAALRESFEDPDRFWENNVEKSKPIFDYCGENDIRLLYASSAGAHGWWQNPYAITKKVNEIQAPPNSVGMRFFNVWAEENSRPDMLYRMLQENTAKYITRHYRDYIHVTDVVRAICLLMDSNFRGHLDIGYGEAIPVMDIAKSMGRDLPIKEDTPGEPDSLCADTRVLRQLGWYPTINIKDTFKGNDSTQLAAQLGEIPFEET
jgi:nucleoside-diphosphate-sugar epimerase